MPPFRTNAEAPNIDIKALTIESPNLLSQLGPAFVQYNEEQFATVKLPGSSQHVSLPDTGQLEYWAENRALGYSQLSQFTWRWKILRRRELNQFPLRS